MSGRLARWLAAALLLLGAGSARGAPLDDAALRTIPTIVVIRLATARYQWFDFGDEESRRKRLAEIAALDPKVQTLVWLAVLENGMTEQTEANNFAPSSFISMGLSFAPIGKALADAGLGAQAAAFAAAEAEAGKTQPGGPGTIELGKAFGTKAAFDAAILAYVRGSPAASAWCDQARAHLSDADRLRALLDALGRQDAPDWLRDWPEPYRVLLLADFFDDEVGNGGVHQYFYNSSGDNAPETVEAMRALGLPGYAETLLRGMAFFAKPYPKDRGTRLDAFDHDGFTQWDDRLDALTGSVDDGKLRPAMVAYAKRMDLLPR